MSKFPNIILIMTDQQRFDTIRALGAASYITPNLDRLVREGMTFDNCYCAAPTCMPSRAALFNCKFPGRTGVYSNSDSWGESWVSRLADAGYHCVNVGKMHTYPYDTPCGFHQRYVVENKDRRCDRMGLDNHCGRFEDELDKFFAWNGLKKPERKFFAENFPDYYDAVGCFTWPYEERFHHDAFVGDMAQRVIERRTTDEPLFLQIGFPGPHPPFDPPQRFLDMYDEEAFSGDIISAEEAAQQPRAQRMFRERGHTRGMDGVIWPVEPTPAQIRRMRKSYAANVTMIDEKIGQIMDRLQQGGYLDDAIVIFTSDHGECLGDHRLFEKWCMYDCITRIPMILWSSGERVPRGKRTDALLQQFDIIHTVFDMLGLSLPDDVQSHPIGDLHGEIAGREAVFAEHAQDHVMRGCQFMTMARTREYKLVHYQNEQQENELYDLRNDPEERHNLYHDPSYRDVRDDMIMRMLNFKCEHHYGVPEIYKECLANEPPVKL